MGFGTFLILALILSTLGFEPKTTLFYLLTAYVVDCFGEYLFGYDNHTHEILEIEPRQKNNS